MVIWPEPVKQILVRPFTSLAKTQPHWVQVLMYVCVLPVMQHIQHCSLAYICLHFQNFMQTTPMGGGMCGPELGHTSAVCMETLLEPHSPDLIPRGHYAYCKGGATQLHPCITASLV